MNISEQTFEHVGDAVYEQDITEKTFEVSGSIYELGILEQTFIWFSWWGNSRKRYVRRNSWIWLSWSCNMWTTCNRTNSWIWFSWCNVWTSYIRTNVQYGLIRSAIHEQFISEQTVEYGLFSHWMHEQGILKQKFSVV